MPCFQVERKAELSRAGRARLFARPQGKGSSHASVSHPVSARDLGTAEEMHRLVSGISHEERLTEKRGAGDLRIQLTCPFQLAITYRVLCTGRPGDPRVPDCSCCFKSGEATFLVIGEVLDKSATCVDLALGWALGPGCRRLRNRKITGTVSSGVNLSRTVRRYAVVMSSMFLWFCAVCG